MYAWAGFRDKQYYDYNPDEKERILLPINKTPRQILIDVGMLGRGYDDNIWINACLKSQDLIFYLLLIYAFQMNLKP